MRKPMLILENLGKCYRPLAERKDTLRDIVGSWRRSQHQDQSVAKRDSLDPKIRWALKGITATIHAGETVGVIGHNGAGKSTLLKLISRITAPSQGRLTICGTLASLLEVGVGFHPDLTGRENVYLAGVLLRLSKSAIERNIAAIRDFAELGEAFDWPVRTYSSGMYMRLGFAVAAHLRSDIVLLDEVLAVGDLRFQQKCCSFLHELRRRGVIVVLVSHNLFLIKSLCGRVLYLKQGKLVYDGDAVSGVEKYERESYLSLPDWAQTVMSSPNSGFAVEHIEINNALGQPSRVFAFGDLMNISVRLKRCQPIYDANVVISVIRQDGLPCCAYSSYLDGAQLSHECDLFLVQVTVPRIRWIAERYRIDVLVWDTSFHKLYAAAKGPYISVQHPLLSKEFGVYHEEALWDVQALPTTG